MGVPRYVGVSADASSGPGYVPGGPVVGPSYTPAPSYQPTPSYPRTTPGYGVPSYRPHAAVSPGYYSAPSYVGPVRQTMDGPGSCCDAECLSDCCWVLCCCGLFGLVSQERRVRAN